MILLKIIVFCQFLPFLTFFVTFGVLWRIPEKRPSIQGGFSAQNSGSIAGLKTEKMLKNR
jgi:hypothetical protein